MRRPAVRWLDDGPHVEATPTLAYDGVTTEAVVTLRLFDEKSGCAIMMTIAATEALIGELNSALALARTMDGAGGAR